MVLQPLEFSDCYTDSPWFRQSIKEHEDALTRTSNAIKEICKESKLLIKSTEAFANQYKAFAEKLAEFSVDGVGEMMTDREKNLTSSIKEYGCIMGEIARPWLDSITEITESFQKPFEKYRKNEMQKYKEQKKKFDKSSEHYYKLLQSTLSLSHKKKTCVLQEHDRELFRTKIIFQGETLNYVSVLQDIQEQNKMKCVESITTLMKKSFKPFKEAMAAVNIGIEYTESTESQLDVAIAEVAETRLQRDSLMHRMKASPESANDHSLMNGRWSRCGYLNNMENKATVRLTSKWTKFFCTYNKESRIFQTATPYPQNTSTTSVLTGGSGHVSSGVATVMMDSYLVITCTGRASDSGDKRFCFDLQLEDIGSSTTRNVTCQATSEEDRRKWMGVMDGKQPEIKSSLSSGINSGKIELRRDLPNHQFKLDEIGFRLIENVLTEIERRGVDTEGIYRINGVISKVDTFISTALNPKTASTVISSLPDMDFNTLTSSLKSCFRNMDEPVCTFDLHHKFVEAAKLSDPDQRYSAVKSLVDKLPQENQKSLKLLSHHLSKVVQSQALNKMNLMNIAVCFGPTLLRDKQETVQSIYDLKFCNTVVEMFVENCDQLFPCGDEEVANATGESESYLQNSTVTLRKKQDLKSPYFVRLPSQRLKRNERACRDNWEGKLSTFTPLNEDTESLSKMKHVQHSGDSDDDVIVAPGRFQRSKAFRSNEKKSIVPRPTATTPSATTETESDTTDEDLLSDYFNDKFHTSYTVSSTSLQPTVAAQPKVQSTISKSSVPAARSRSKVTSLIGSFTSNDNLNNNHNNNEQTKKPVMSRVGGGRSVMVRRSNFLANGPTASQLPTSNSFHGGLRRAFPASFRTQKLGFDNKLFSERPDARK